MKGYEILVFGMFGTGFGVVIGAVHKDMNMGIIFLGLALVMAIAPNVKKKFDSIPA